MAAAFSLMIDKGLLSQRGTGEFETLEAAKQSAQEHVIKTEAQTAAVILDSTGETIVTYRKFEDDE